ncbi:hypothetical protein CRV08_08690 [Halarcobacter ebronensis]|uniref:Uncharacterized protein n=1 Tax=Halarcobacter ebronensis TaxID=1462615 RepID=A0A4V1LRI5_9BACT|nr:hypothetical protein [Halarcobacter ebronensis]RXJ68318.1 hypothetical protein CRV08_08690 [Halarcobacter ebronensis]
MKKSLKIPLYIFTFLLFFIMSMPKENLYYYLEEKIKNNNLVISQEIIHSNYFSFDVNKGNVTYKKELFFYFDLMTFSLTGISIKNISLYDEKRKEYLPSLQNFKITASIINPKQLSITGSGLIGEVEGYVDIINKKLILNLNATKYMKKNFRNYLINMEFKNGKYYYVYQL